MSSLSTSFIKLNAFVCMPASGSYIVAMPTGTHDRRLGSGQRTYRPRSGQGYGLVWVLVWVPAAVVRLNSKDLFPLRLRCAAIVRDSL